MNIRGVQVGLPLVTIWPVGAQDGSQLFNTPVAPT